jgi:hypothetical protein
MKDCTCVCEVDVHEWPQFHQVATRKARKRHRCCECNEPIMPGQLYEHVSGKWDGTFSVVRTCLRCARIRDDFCRSYIYGGLREALWHCLGLDYITGHTIDEED